MFHDDLPVNHICFSGHISYTFESKKILVVIRVKNDVKGVKVQQLFPQKVSTIFTKNYNGITRATFPKKQHALINILTISRNLNTRIPYFHSISSQNHREGV